MKNGCETGCKIFTGGEIKHHKDCQYYAGSFSKMYDELEVKYRDIMRENNALNEKILHRLKLNNLNMNYTNELLTTLLLSEMLVKSKSIKTNDDIVELTSDIAGRIVKLFAVPDVSKNSKSTFKTLVFTDQRKDTLGRYVSIIQGQFYGGEVPKLCLPIATIEAFKDTNPDLDFTGIELIEIEITEKQ